MRKFLAIAEATTLEILSEPLSLLLCLVAMLLSTLAPTFHYHQFGEPTRMARDAGFSSLLVFGIVFAVVGTVRTFRRELEGGTATVALAHPVSRTSFFLAKTFGAFVAYTLFAVTVTLNSYAVVNGAAIGGVMAKHDCDIARLHGPSVALAMATVIVPLVLAAALNRWRRSRFTLTAMLTLPVLSALMLAYRPDFALWGRLLPVSVLVALPAVVFLSATAAFAARWRTNLVALGVGLLAVAALPALGNYYLADALSRGGSLPAGYFWAAAGLLVPATVGFLVLGAHLFAGRDVA